MAAKRQHPQQRAAKRQHPQQQEAKRQHPQQREASRLTGVSVGKAAPRRLGVASGGRRGRPSPWVICFARWAVYLQQEGVGG